MSLDIYENSAYPTGDALSKDNTMTQPLEATIPAGDESSAIPLWACTADTNFYYTDINLYPEDIDGTDESSWIALAPDDGGSPGSFGAFGASMLDIGDVGPGSSINTPFWIKFAVPAGTGAQIKTDLKLRMTYTKHAVAT